MFQLCRVIISGKGIRFLIIHFYVLADCGCSFLGEKHLLVSNIDEPYFEPVEGLFIFSILVCFDFFDSKVIDTVCLLHFC